MTKMEPIKIEVSPEATAAMQAFAERIEQACLNMSEVAAEAIPQHQQCRSTFTPPQIKGWATASDRWATDPMDLMRFISPTRLRRWLSLKLWNFSCDIEALSLRIDPDR